MNREYPLKLSIIVPVYNVEKYLERCVNSLLHQDIDKSEYEIILVNDGSTDSSYEKAEKLKEENANIVLFTQENKGQSAARNVGLDIAKGKYIMFVDSDDYIEKNVVGRLLDMTETNHLDLCFYQMSFDYQDGSRLMGKKRVFKNDVVYDGEYLLLHGIEVSAVWLNIYSSKFLLSTGLKFYEGIIHEDVEFCYRMYPLAKRVMFSDMIVYHYCVYGESTLRTQNPIKIRKIIESDFHVSSSVLRCSKSDVYSDKIRQHYAQVGSSIAVSALIQLWRSTYLDYQAKMNCLNTAKSLGVYPITERTNSWKTTVLSRLLNCEWLFKWLIK